MKQIIFLLGLIISLQIIWIVNNAWGQSESFDPYQGLNPKMGRLGFKPQNVIQEYNHLCSLYDRKGFYPQSEGECPDSSFTYVANVAANVPGSQNPAPGCVQLKEAPYCSIQPDGTYRPNFVKLLYRVSP
jgi:hypothetical protein